MQRSKHQNFTAYKNLTTMSIYSESVENKLNDLVELSYDAEKGFKKACENCDDPKLKNYFTNKANERSQFRNELTSELRANNLEIEEKDGSFGGTIHRAWMDTKAFFSGDDTESMLEEVRNGEKRALEEYDDILGMELPQSTASVLRNQRQVIEASCNKADRLEDVM